MDLAVKKRADQAWQESRSWITSFDGTPHVTLLVNVPPDGLLAGLAALSQHTENFRITTIATGHLDEPQFIPLETLPPALEELREGKLAELSVNYATRLPAFDLDIHMVIYAVKEQKVALELDWWSDQVFSEEVDPYTQFTALVDYFIQLQNLFASPNLFIGPESGKDPSGEAESWVEI